MIYYCFTALMYGISVQQEQNMVGYQYGNHMFYYTYGPIKAHSEILG